MRLIVLVSILCLLIASISSIAYGELGTTTMRFYATEDAKVSSSDPNTNTGDRQLRVEVQPSSIYRSYIKFNVSDIPAQSIVLASNLSVFKFGGTGTSNVNLQRVLNNNWNENIITWNNQPTQYSSVVSTTFFDTTLSTKIIEATPPVSSAVSERNQTVSLVLRDSNENSSVNPRTHLLQNKEQSTNGPILDVTFISNKPNISQMTFPQTANEGQMVTLGFHSNDVDNNIVLTKIYLDNLIIATSNSTNITTNYTFNFEQSGTRTVRFYVEDRTGLFDEEVRTITVANVEHMKINEFVPIPFVGSGEWIELYNPTMTNFNVTGCYLRDGFGNRIDIQGILASHTTGVINNQPFLTDTGDIVMLLCNETLVDRVTYGSWNDSNILDNAPLSLEGQSIGRVQDGVDTDVDNVDFRVYTQPTKDAPNGNPQNCEDSDQNCNGCVSLVELLAYIARWKADSNDVTLLELLHAIDLWKSAQGC